ncbi:MAG: phage portal protein [Bacteroidales bacterium]|nr:phage portal protein [Bacteroidales bacterium]
MSFKEKIKGIFGAIANEINAAVGYQQTFTELLDNNDVTRAIGLLEKRSDQAVKNLLEYNTKTHKVMNRPAKAIYDKNGDFIRNKEVNRVAIPYHKFINEIALVFMYGRPVLWSNATPNPRADERRLLQEQLGQPEHSEEVENTIAEIDAYSEMMDAKFQRLKDQLDDCRFDAHLREAKRYAGCEGCSAMLFHTYQEDGEPRMLIRVLAKSKNDDIYTLFDQYNRLTAFAWGYTTLNADNKSVYHYDIYTKEFVYYCQNVGGSRWEVDKKPNLVKKIPVIVFIQEVEWDGTQSIIERIEDAYSRNADSNDNFADPALVATADIINTLPKQEEESKLYVLKNGGDIKYLERSNANQARQDEIDALDEQAMSKSFTPNITIEDLRGLANASGTTLEHVMMLGTIKADMRKETHDGYLSRTGNLMKAIMGNVLDVKGGSYEELVIHHEFQPPFGDDVAIAVDRLMRQYGGGGMSLQTLLEKSPLIDNADKEMERINKEKSKEDERRKQASLMDVFEPTL